MKRLLIIITPFIFTMMAFRINNTINVSGKITDRGGTPLNKISVVIKGDNAGTVSSKDGKYKLAAVKTNAVLVFSATGFKTFEVPVKGRTEINVMLDTSIKLSGVIKDKTGVPVSGATVRVKGSKVGTASATDGTYSLYVDKGNVALEFTSVGFQTQEVKTKNKTIIDVTLEQTVQAMEEVVVVGYYAPKKSKSISYSIASVSAKDISSSKPATVQGKAAGVQVYGATSGATSNIRVRGISSINNSNSYNQSPQTAYEDFNTEGYDKIVENGFHKATDNPLSTFSIDVDAASYSNVRRFLNAGQLPPAGAVRIEEMVNYFKYDYPQPANDDPFSINTEIADAPWNKNHKLVLIGLQGKKIETEKLPACNLVFLIDVSGSMMQANKLPLVKQSMKLLVDQLRPQDKVSMVVYAGAAGLVLPSTKGSDKQKLKEAIDILEAGGSTAGGAGIKLAYKTAKENFIKNGNNRVILCTDGDFNIGESSDDAMERLIEEERKSGVFLTVLGYGMGNYKDSKMQKLADKGNGNHAYIDGLSEARKVLVSEFGGTMFAIAKDVKLQVEFNPAKVQGYRLIGYENRMLAKEDFNDDKKDAGEMGSNHTVTALYEIIPVGVKTKLLKKVDTLKYGNNMPAFSKSSYTDELMTVKLRYKKPDGDVSKLLEYPVRDNQLLIADASDNFRFAAAVAEFGMLLRNSEFKFKSSYGDVLALARKAKGNDEEGYRSEFIQLVKSAQTLADTKEDEGGGEGE